MSLLGSLNPLSKPFEVSRIFAFFSSVPNCSEYVLDCLMNNFISAEVFDFLLLGIRRSSLYYSGFADWWVGNVDCIAQNCTPNMLFELSLLEFHNIRFTNYHVNVLVKHSFVSFMKNPIDLKTPALCALSAKFRADQNKSLLDKLLDRSRAIGTSFYDKILLSRIISEYLTDGDFSGLDSINKLPLFIVSTILRCLVIQKGILSPLFNGLVENILHRTDLCSEDVCDFAFNTFRRHNMAFTGVNGIFFEQKMLLGLWNPFLTHYSGNVNIGMIILHLFILASPISALCKPLVEEVVPVLVDLLNKCTNFENISYFDDTVMRVMEILLEYCYSPSVVTHMDKFVDYVMEIDINRTITKRCSCLKFFEKFASSKLLSTGRWNYLEFIESHLDDPKRIVRASAVNAYVAFLKVTKE